MSTAIQRVAPGVRRNVTADTTRITAVRALLACGILYAVLYPFVNDAIAATLYDGYSRMDQAVSELSATDAPTQTFLTIVGPFFSLLAFGFGIGIWKAAGTSALLGSPALS